jgi:hypothetical protein
VDRPDQAAPIGERIRMVDEGVASAADIDKAVKYGFGFRFAVLGLLGSPTGAAAIRFITPASTCRRRSIIRVTRRLR